MFNRVVAAAAFSFCALLPFSTHASPITITFDVKNASATDLVKGSFTFDSSLDGTVLSYGSLSAFTLSFPSTGANYDLAFVNSGGFQAPYLNFEFDSSIDEFLFNTSNAAGSPLAAIKAGYLDGFWVGNNTAVGDYSAGGPNNLGTRDSVTYSRSLVGTVPEPGSLALLGVALACAAAVARRRQA